MPVHMKPHHLKQKCLQHLNHRKTSLIPQRALCHKATIHPLTEVTATTPQGAACSLGETHNHTRKMQLRDLVEIQYLTQGRYNERAGNEAPERPAALINTLYEYYAVHLKM